MAERVKVLILSNSDDYEVIYEDAKSRVYEQMGIEHEKLLDSGFKLTSYRSDLDDEDRGHVCYNYNKNGQYACSLISCDGVAENVEVINLL